MNAPAQAGLPALPLRDPKLFREQCYIDGQWVGADAKKTLAVINPANGQALGTVPDLGTAETRRAIQAAERAWPAWRAKTAKERAVILRKWFDLMMASQDDLAQLLTAEQGKPLAEARGEIAYGASFIEWFAEEGKRAYGDTIPSPWTDKRVLVIKQPIGVSALITPWNFPNAMITRKAGPALAAGCTVVLKPPGKTPTRRSPWLSSASAPASRKACSTSSPEIRALSAASCAPTPAYASSPLLAPRRPGARS